MHNGEVGYRIAERDLVESESSIGCGRTTILVSGNAAAIDRDHLLSERVEQANAVLIKAACITFRHPHCAFTTHRLARLIDGSPEIEFRVDAVDRAEISVHKNEIAVLLA